MPIVCSCQELDWCLVIQRIAVLHARKQWCAGQAAGARLRAGLGITSFLP